MGQRGRGAAAARRARASAALRASTPSGAPVCLQPSSASNSAFIAAIREVEGHNSTARLKAATRTDVIDIFKRPPMDIWRENLASLKHKTLIVWGSPLGSSPTGPGAG